MGLEGLLCVVPEVDAHADYCLSLLLLFSPISKNNHLPIFLFPSSFQLLLRLAERKPPLLPFTLTYCTLPPLLSKMDKIKEVSLPWTPAWRGSSKLPASPPYLHISLTACRPTRQQHHHADPSIF